MYVYMYIYVCICMHIDAYTYNLLWNIPTNLQARYDLFCVKSAVKPQPTNQMVTLPMEAPNAGGVG